MSLSVAAADALPWKTSHSFRRYLLRVAYLCVERVALGPSHVDGPLERVQVERGVERCKLAIDTLERSVHGKLGVWRLHELSYAVGAERQRLSHEFGAPR